MPPKQQPNKKTVEKAKAKIVEDKTFGLKNKSGAKQQKFIQQVQKQVSNKGAQKNPRDLLDPLVDREKKKEEEKKKKEELNQLFKPVAQTVPKGVDPKSIVCAFFKQGICQKGDKCKFSHDLSVQRKAEKRNIYEDTRENTMENWDEEKLEDVVNQKHGADNIKKNQTQIVCKYFIEAVENKTYGWFWTCPNGETCMYRHALPPGFTLKSEMKKKSEEDEISLEMLIEKERASLGAKVTKVTLESFLAWKQRKLIEKKDEIRKKEDKKRADFKLGFVNGLTGRDLFTFNPDLITNDDDEAGNDIDYKQRAEDDEEIDQNAVRELNAEYFVSQAREVDDTGTVATSDRFSYLESMLEKEREDAVLRKKHKEEENMACGSGDIKLENLDENESEGEEDDNNGEEDDNDNENDNDEEKEKENLKNSLINNDTVQSKQLSNNKNTTSSNKAIKTTNATDKTNGKIEIDESLFNLDDLADIQDELENLDI